MKFKRGQLVIINKKEYSGKFSDLYGACLVIRSPSFPYGPYCLWSTKEQDEVYIYEHQLSSINPQEDKSEV